MTQPDAPLLAAAVSFTTGSKAGGRTSGHTGAHVERVVGTLDTTVTLLVCGTQRVLLVASHFGISSEDIGPALQKRLSAQLDIPTSHILVLSSHNHSVPLLEKQPLTGHLDKPNKSDPLPLGKKFLQQAATAARQLPRRLQPVSVWWGLGSEGRITYNRKGRRADGTTYFMREEDRGLLGKDFRGDIDEEAPVICLKGNDGKPVTFLVQYNGHPVTTYHPEHQTVFGDWPQVACQMLARRSDARHPVPVSFMQGCCGDVNSKHMFSGDVALARRYGRYLGDAYIKACRSLRPSRRGGMDFATTTAELPLAPLPAASTLERELREMEGFVRRAAAGDEDTLTCVGLNFARAMTPAYRGKLVEYVMPWNRWALDLHRRRKAHTVRKAFSVDVNVLRLGDVAIATMPCEPFIGIGRLFRKLSPLPLSIPCGYTNMAGGYVGYVPDSPNTGDREYMSAFYRYTRYLPDFRRPAGDVMAHAAAATLRQLLKGHANGH